MIAKHISRNWNTLSCLAIILMKMLFLKENNIDQVVGCVGHNQQPDQLYVKEMCCTV